MKPLDELRRIAGPTLVVSRAASAEVRRMCAAARDVVIEAPALRGKTVWEAVPEGFAVVETPNWWGRREALPESGTGCVIDRRHGLRIGETNSGADPEDWEERIASLRRCLRAVAQLPRVRAAHGDPEAPWALVLLPVAAEAVAGRCSAGGIGGVAALAPRLPEFPGGLRIEAGADAGTEWCQAVVASIRYTMERSGAA